MDDALYPFGFGLSYTNFTIGEAKISKSVINPTEPVELTIPVKNTGKHDGTEIIQVYVHKMIDSDGPIKTLRGFQRIDVQKGKTGYARITLNPTAFEFYNHSNGKMMTEAGEYEIMYGNSSSNSDLKVIKISIN